MVDGINAPVPRIFTSLDNASQAARKRGYMRALTTANIESIFYPALVAAVTEHLPGWIAQAERDGELNVFDAVTSLVWDAVATYIYGGISPAEESQALRVKTDAILSALARAPVFSRLGGRRRRRGRRRTSQSCARRSPHCATRTVARARRARCSRRLPSTRARTG